MQLTVLENNCRFTKKISIIIFQYDFLRLKIINNNLFYLPIVPDFQFSHLPCQFLLQAFQLAPLTAIISRYFKYFHPSKKFEKVFFSYSSTIYPTIPNQSLPIPNYPIQQYLNYIQNQPTQILILLYPSQNLLNSSSSFSSFSPITFTPNSLTFLK